MRTHSLLVLPLAAFAAVACADRALTAPEAATSRPLLAKGVAGSVTTKFTVPVEFTLPAGSCGLTTDVTGSGELRFTVHVTTTGNGEYHAIFDSKVSGSATDADGGRYRFSYVSNVRLYDFTVAPGAIPAPIGATASWVDLFHLVSAGDAPNIAVHQRLTMTFDENGTPTVLRAEVRGDRACDPI